MSHSSLGEIQILADMLASCLDILDVMEGAHRLMQHKTLQLFAAYH